MEIFKKQKLSDFQPIELQEDIDFDFSQYKELSNLLKRISRTSQKSSQQIELLRDEIDSTLATHKDLADKIKVDNRSLNEDINLYQKALLDYLDILDGLENAADQIDDKKFLDAVRVALKASNSIIARVGIQSLEGVGDGTDADIHYVIGTAKTDITDLRGTIQTVVRKGYRRGSTLLRKADVIVYE